MNANAPHDGIDNTIDRALSALRDAAPRPGLEGRILASLDHRATTHAMDPGGLPFHSFIVKGWGIVCGRGFRRVYSLGWGSKRESASRTAHIALWTAASTAVLAVASLLILHRHTAPTEIARTPIIRVAHRFANAKGWGRDANPVTNLADSAQRPTNAVILRRSRRTPVFENCPDHQSFGCPVHDGGAAVGMSGMTTPTDAQALADLHAPSHPAPPLPLTPQEKLFIRMLRYGNLTQLAELDPIARAKKDADEAIDFKFFFPDQPPLHQPGDNE